MQICEHVQAACADICIDVCLVTCSGLLAFVLLDIPDSEHLRCTWRLVEIMVVCTLAPL